MEHRPAPQAQHRKVREARCHRVSWCRRRFGLWSGRLRAGRAQVAFDHGQPVDHMAERVVNGFERILRMAVGFRLAEANVGQFALDDIGKAAVCGCWLAPAIGGKGRNARVLTFEMVQDVLQPFLYPSEIVGSGICGGLQPLEQIGYALFEMGEGGRVVVADRHAVETIGQGPQRILDLLGIFMDRRPLLAALQRRSQRGDALFEDRQ